MDLYLQFGFGMMGISRELLGRWGSGTVILSPRDLEPEQIPRFASQVNRLGGSCMIDPQFYEPRANWPRLCRHAYWPSDYNTGMLTDGSSLRRLLGELKNLNELVRA